MAASQLMPEYSSSDNSLTAYMKSLTNTLGQSGQNVFQGGQDVFSKGLSDFGPSLDYFQKILSGNKAQMESAVAPEKADILSQYRAKRKQIAATGARGGGTNEAVAQSEFGQAGDVAGLLQKLRPQAAQAEAGIAGEIAKLGLSESGIGNEQLFNALQGLLARRGQNFSMDQSNMQNLTAGLESVFSTLM